MVRAPDRPSLRWPLLPSPRDDASRRPFRREFLTPPGTEWLTTPKASRGRGALADEDVCGDRGARARAHARRGRPASARRSRPRPGWTSGTCTMDAPPCRLPLCCALMWRRPPGPHSGCVPGASSGGWSSSDAEHAFARLAPWKIQFALGDEGELRSCLRTSAKSSWGLNPRVWTRRRPRRHGATRRAACYAAPGPSWNCVRSRNGMASFASLHHASGTDFRPNLRLETIGVFVLSPRNSRRHQEV